MLQTRQEVRPKFRQQTASIHRVTPYARSPISTSPAFHYPTFSHITIDQLSDRFHRLALSCQDRLGLRTGILHRASVYAYRYNRRKQSTIMDLEQTSTSSLRSSLEPISIPSDSPRAAFSNWAKTFHCKPERVFAPTTVEQCRSIVELARMEGARLHPVGVGHSPSDLACTNGWLMRMEGVKGMINVGLIIWMGVSQDCADCLG